MQHVPSLQQSRLQRRVPSEELTLQDSLTARTVQEAKVPSGLSPFTSGLKGSLSSSPHENYSKGELKRVCGHSEKKLPECHNHSLATQRVEEAYTKWEDSRNQLHFPLIVSSHITVGMSIAVPSLLSSVTLGPNCLLSTELEAVCVYSHFISPSS